MSTWQEHVTKHASQTTGFPACAISDLSHFGLIRVSGPDARTFLQGQLTNDIHAVTAERAQISSYCSPKGRMLGSFWIFQRDEDLFLLLPKVRLDAVLKRLRMFILRAQVLVEDASDTLARFGIAGECAAALLPVVPTEDRASITRDEITVFRMPGDRPRFGVVGPDSRLTPIWDQAATQATPTNTDFWALMDIRAGLPNVLEETVEAFVPQMVNLQLIDGVSFSKGCYTGQEVVARMQYLGKLKRRMYRARVDANEPPAPGSEVFAANGDADTAVGRIVDAAPSPDGGFEVLAVLQISSAETDQLRLGEAIGP
ncbi:MAG: folate-binding protein, partial [Chromatiaceae bacterium]